MPWLGVCRRALFEPGGRIDLSSKKILQFPIHSFSALMLAVMRHSAPGMPARE
jgi:hypothetical protein